MGLALLLPLLAACGSETATPGDDIPAPDQGIGGDYVSNGLPAPFTDGDVMRLTLADGSECWVTVHPSFLLRIPERDRRDDERAKFVNDLKRIKARAEALVG